ncbi:MAG: DUF4080 domain-containing protein [Clostridia bacterium]|nr:DUF4080 domain-containing protein [Clostridia bacterium]
MKVIISTLNSKYIHSSLAPWCLFTACREYCKETHDIKVIEGTVNEKIKAVLDRILTEKPDAVAFSVYIWNKERTLALCREIKSALPDTAIILGGPEVAYNQRTVLEKHSFADYVLSGEGEIILPRLLDCISSDLLPEDINGVSYRKDDKLVVKNEAIGESFDYPSPYCEEYFDTLGGRLTYIETSRGCPFNCAYCLSGRCGKVKFKTLEQTKRELLLLANSGTKTVKFVDRTFNCNNVRAVEILRFINDNYGKSIPRGVCFHFEISADILKADFISEVARAEKCAFQFEAGIQSMNADTLSAIGRKCDMDKLCENIKRLVALRNCHIHTDLIAGLPEESLESFIEGFNKSYELGADMLQLGFLKLLHGSPLRENAAAFPCKFSPEPPYEIISTPTMTQADLDTLRTAEKEVDRLHNSGRFTRTLEYIFEATDLAPFELYLFLGKELTDKSLPLDRYTDALYGLLSRLDGVEPAVLRDRMIYDRLATNNSGVIPKSLYVEDSRLKKAKHRLALAYPIKKGVSRSVAILYSEGRVIFSDYGKDKPTFGEYDIREENFDFFGETFFDFDIDK